MKPDREIKSDKGYFCTRCEHLCDNGSCEQQRPEGGESGNHGSIWRNIQAEMAACRKAQRMSNPSRRPVVGDEGRQKQGLAVEGSVL